MSLARWLIPAAAAGLAACSSARLASSTPTPEAWPRLPPGCIGESADSDGDGLADECELNLAVSFAPILMQSPTRCTPPPSRARSEIPGGYLHAVQPIRGTIRLLYMPAYYRDCGWTGPKCLVVNCAPHAGDSEIIVIDLVPEADGWSVAGVFLSAHCFGRIQSDCRWYEGDELAEFAWSDERRGAPVIWVSDGRHANYPSRSACERGHLRIDTCNPDARAVRFPVRATHNVGSREHPIRERDLRAGCVSGAFVEPRELLLVGRDEVECFWDPETPFRGWQGPGEGVTAYGRYLQIMGL